MSYFNSTVTSYRQPPVVEAASQEPQTEVEAHDVTNIAHENIPTSELSENDVDAVVVHEQSSEEVDADDAEWETLVNWAQVEEE